MDEFFLVVHVAGLEPGQALGQLGRVALRALHAGGAEEKRRARIQRDAERGARSHGVHVGLAVRDAPARIARGQQLAQGLGLGVGPALLGEAPALIQRPGVQDGLALFCDGRIGAGGDVAGKANVHPRHGGGLARLDGDAHHGARAGVVVAAHLHRGAEIALRAQQRPHVAFGKHQQTRPFAVIQILDGAIALQRVEAFDECAQGLVVALHADVEGGGFGGLSGGCGGAGSG